MANVFPAQRHHEQEDTHIQEAHERFWALCEEIISFLCYISSHTLGTLKYYTHAPFLN